MTQFSETSRKRNLREDFKCAEGTRSQTLVSSTQNHQEPHHVAALALAYKEIYLPLFPPAEGYDSIEDWKESLGNPFSPKEYKITIAGYHLTDDSTPTVVTGLCVSTYFKDSDTGYLGYIAVAPEYRAEGLGHCLFRQHETSMLESARQNGGTLRGMFLDCQNPEMKNHDEYDPRKRVNKYIKWGGHHVPCQYLLPIRNQPEKTVDWLNLISFGHPVTGKHATPQVMADFMRSMYRDNGVQNPEGHPGFRQSVRSMQEMPPPEYHQPRKLAMVR